MKLRELFDDFEQQGWPDPGHRPDREVAEQDLFEAIQEQFSEDELEIVSLWLDGTSWEDIGQEFRIHRRRRANAGSTSRPWRVRKKMNG